MQLELVKLSQDFNLESRSTDNFVVLRLPGGELVRLSATEEVVNQLVNAAMGAPPPAPRSRAPEAPQPAVALSSEFGGDYVPEEPVQMAPPTRPEGPPAPAPRVDKDAYGYPVRYDSVGVDPGEVTGGPNADEDGVGSL